MACAGLLCACSRLLRHALELKVFVKPGGVCPFCAKDGVRVYLDESLKRFDIIYPAAGSSNSAVRLTVDELLTLSNALGWVDVTKSAL